MIAHLQADHVCVSRQRRSLLENVNVRVQPGEFVSIEGPSGIGKSTLLLALAGLHPVERGTVVIGGTPVSELPLRERACRLAIAVQSPVFPPDLTLRDYVRLGCQRSEGKRGLLDASRGCDSDRDVVEEVLDAVALRAADHRTLATLSGGEQRRAQLARVLAQRTPVVLLDEPTTHLDEETCHRIIGVLCQRVRDGVAVLMATHDGAVARRYCQRRLWLQDKTLVSAPQRPKETPARLGQRVQGL